MSKGILYAMPTTLGSEDYRHVIPAEIVKTIIETRHFAVENIKTARRYLRKLDKSFPIDDSTFFILNKNSNESDCYPMLKPLNEGHNIGILSEAGCPGIADPGSELIKLAHEKGHFVSPLTGPSSILLALIGSGFNGQNFAFSGYLPKERKDRVRKLKYFENTVKRENQTQVFMDTPFRNIHVLEDLLNELADDTKICIACDLTLPSERIQTMTVKNWRENAFDISKKPTMFVIGR